MSKIDSKYKNSVIDCYNKASVFLSDEEIANIDYADFGLGNIWEEALNLVIYVNNDRYCAKEMVLLPNQTCPEHSHPSFSGRVGKQETLRCRWGKLFLYVESNKVLNESEIQVKIPSANKKYYTAGTEIILFPGDQYTINPDTLHWFKAGENGAVISEFSSPSDDASDIFTNPNVQRVIKDR